MESLSNFSETALYIVVAYVTSLSSPSSISISLNLSWVLSMLASNSCNSRSKLVSFINVLHYVVILNNHGIRAMFYASLLEPSANLMYTWAQRDQKFRCSGKICLLSKVIHPPTFRRQKLFVPWVQRQTARSRSAGSFKVV